MRKLVILFLFISLPIYFYGQNSSSYSKDTSMVRSYMDSTLKYLYSGNKKTLFYINKIDSLSINSNYNFGLYKSNLLYGAYSFIKGDHNQAIIYYKKSLNYCDTNNIKNYAGLCVNLSYAYTRIMQYDSSIYYLNKITSLDIISDYPGKLVSAVFSKANVRLQQNNYMQALVYIEEGEKILETIEPRLENTTYYSIIGNFYKSVEDFDKAYNAYNKCIDNQIQFKTTKDKWRMYLQIAYLHMRIKLDYDSALYYAFKGINENEYEFSGVDSLNFNLQIGNIFFEKNDIDSSTYYYLQVLNNNKFEKYPYFQAAIYTNLGMYYRKKNDYDKANEYLLSGLEISKDYELLKFQENALIELALNEEKANKIPSAYKYLKEYNAIVDSLKKEETLQHALDLEYNTYQTKRKYQNEVLTERVAGQDKKIIYQRIGMFVVLNFLLIIFVILYYVHKSKQKISTLNNRLNEALEKSRNLSLFKENMTNMIVHDLKNPLNAILNTDLIEDKITSDEIVKYSGYRMLNLIDNIMNVYKYENSKMQLRKNDISLKDVLNNSLEEVHYVANKKMLQISTNKDLECIINSDSDILRRVFVNLLTNAVKFSPNNSEIQIKASIHNKDISISIINQGPIIAAKNQKLIFELFTQAEQRASGEIKSTGLGLTFCKMAIEAHQGTIGVNSDEINGTEFWFKLPNSFISQEIISSKEESKCLLSDEDKTYLIPYITKLKNFQVYEISLINKILANIEDKNKSIEYWKNNIESIILSSDSEAYNELLKLN